MISGSLYIKRTEKLLLGEVQKTKTPFERARGLLFRPSLEENQGLLITPCNSVHTFFMRYPLDLIYIDKELKVIKAVEDIYPWRMSMSRGAKGVIECKTGTIQKHELKINTHLIWKENRQ